MVSVGTSLFIFLVAAKTIKFFTYLVILCLNWNFALDLDKLDHISENIVTESTSKRVTKKKSKNRVVKEDVYKVNGINEALKTRKDTQNVSLFSFFLHFILLSWHMSPLTGFLIALIFFACLPPSSTKPWFLL